MATKLTVTQFQAELNNLTNNKFSGVSSERFLRYLNRALLNRYRELKEYVEDEYTKQATLTFATKGFNITLPTDMNKDEISAKFLVYQDSDYVSLISHEWLHPITILAGKLQFRYEQPVGQQYFLLYDKEPSRYTDFTDTIDETSSIRALEILSTEVESLFESDKYQGQMPAQYQAAQLKTNDIS